MIRAKLVVLEKNEILSLREKSIEIFHNLERHKAELQMLNILAEEHSLAFYSLSNLVRGLGRAINEEILRRGIRKDADNYRRCQTFRKKVFNAGETK